MSTSNSTIDPSTLPHDTVQPNIIACAIATWLLGGLFVALRFYTRGVLIRVLGSPDWCILVAWIFSAGLTASTLEQVNHGLGLRQWDFDIANYGKYARAAWLGLIWYYLSLAFSKISILLLYLHIFSYQWVSCVTKIILGIVVVSNLWVLASIFTACVPLHAFWEYPRPDHVYCHPSSVWWANTALHMITDFLIFLLPLPVLATLRVPRRQRWLVLALFGMGFFVCLISILRVTTIITRIEYIYSDYTYCESIQVYWTLVEVNTAIMCACIMTYKPLITKWFPKLLETPRVTFDQQDPYSGEGPPSTIGTRSRRWPLGRRRDSHDSLVLEILGVPAKIKAVLGFPQEDQRNPQNHEHGAEGVPLEGHFEQQDVSDQLHHETVLTNSGDAPSFPKATHSGATSSPEAYSGHGKKTEDETAARAV